MYLNLLQFEGLEQRVFWGPFHHCFSIMLWSEASIKPLLQVTLHCLLVQKTNNAIWVPSNTMSWYCFILSLSSFIELEEILLVHPTVVGQDLHDGVCCPKLYKLESTVFLESLFQPLFILVVILFSPKFWRNVFPSVGDREQLITTLSIATSTH